MCGGGAIKWRGLKGCSEGVGRMPIVGVVIDLAREGGLDLRLEAADEGVEVVGGFADGKVGDYGLEFGGIG